VVIIETYECDDRAIIGDLVAKFLTLYRQVAAVAVVGKVRDAPRIIRERWPVWSDGVTPVGCVNSAPTEEVPVDVLSEMEHRYAGGVAVCDDSGVVVIAASEINESLLKRLEAIEALEDAWYDCIDKRKWDTFDTVCLRRYEA
jgi:regulator of RNase E activity RraA